MPMISKDSEDTIRHLFLNGKSPQDNPAIYCMAGIPGAGKSTYMNDALMRGDFPADAFILDPDRVMLALPEYHAAYADFGAAYAFEQWELPARNLAYAMFEDAASRRAHIIKDMGCARTENYDKLKFLKDCGYRLNMFYIECDVDEAIRRCALRTRHTPPDMIQERALSLDALLPRYRALADCFHAIPRGHTGHAAA